MKMRFFMLSLDHDEDPTEPVLAHNENEAVDLYVQNILDGDHNFLKVYHLKKSVCIWVDEFVAPEAGVGLMKDTLSTSIPLSAIPSWQRYLAPKKNEDPCDAESNLPKP